MWTLELKKLETWSCRDWPSRGRVVEAVRMWNERNDVGEVEMS